MEHEYELLVTLRVKTYGTREQARKSAEKVRSLLSVELHQDVELVRVEYKEVDR